VLRVRLGPASEHDLVGARRVLEGAADQFPRLSVVWADQAYVSEEFAEWARDELGCRVEVVRRRTKAETRQAAWDEARRRLREGASVVQAWSGLSLSRGIEHLPRRWVVERTFAWLGKSRRLGKDYELLPATGEALIHLCMARLLLRRLAKPPPESKNASG